MELELNQCYALTSPQSIYIQGVLYRFLCKNNQAMLCWPKCSLVWCLSMISWSWHVSFKVISIAENSHADYAYFNTFKNWNKTLSIKCFLYLPLQSPVIVDPKSLAEEIDLLSVNDHLTNSEVWYQSLFTFQWNCDWCTYM